MKLNRLSRPPSFWGWVRSNLPPSMAAVEVSIGYGIVCNIYRRGEAPGFLRRSFECEGYPIATVLDKEVRLNYPEYFSDFEDMLRRFESCTGIEPTLTYWESPNA